MKPLRLAFMMTAIDPQGAPVHLARTVVEIPADTAHALGVYTDGLSAHPITTYIGRVRLPRTGAGDPPFIEASVDILPPQLWGIETVSEVEQ